MVYLSWSVARNCCFVRKAVAYCRFWAVGHWSKAQAQLIRMALKAWLLHFAVAAPRQTKFRNFALYFLVFEILALFGSSEVEIGLETGVNCIHLCVYRRIAGPVYLQQQDCEYEWQRARSLTCKKWWSRPTASHLVTFTVSKPINYLLEVASLVVARSAWLLTSQEPSFVRENVMGHGV